MKNDVDSGVPIEVPTRKILVVLSRSYASDNSNDLDDTGHLYKT